MTTRQLMQTRGYHALVQVIYELQQDGQYSDEEGEETNALAELLHAIESLVTHPSPPGRTDDDLTQIIRAKGGELASATRHITELESQLAQRFDAADVATASAQGFRDGVASVSAGSEPVAEIGSAAGDCAAFGERALYPLVDIDRFDYGTMLYAHPSPPEGMAGWRPTSEMRAVVAVAVTMLYDTHPEDVLRVFDLCELEKISSITGLLGSQQVEDIYRRAWDHLTAAPGPADGESNG